MDNHDEDIHHLNEVADFQLECYKDYMRQSRTHRLMAKETKWLWFWKKIYHTYKANQYREYGLQHWELYTSFSGRLDNIAPEHLAINYYGALEHS